MGLTRQQLWHLEALGQFLVSMTDKFKLQRGGNRTSLFVLCVGIVVSLWFGNYLHKMEVESWEASAERTAQGLSSTFLNWLEESYAPVSALMALVENSSQCD